jgi:hypothetical protein
MKKLFFVSLFALAGAAHADQYVCTVYCNSGTTSVSVEANSKADAAAKVDAQGHEICQSDNRGNATEKTMRPEQCSRR